MRKDMSFSGKVKQELLKQLPAARHCQIAELAALFDLNEGYAAGMMGANIWKYGQKT